MSKKKRYTLKNQSESFRCRHCHQLIGVADKKTAGTRHRDHCPHCLYSIHVDNKPGDRAARCHGLMKPVALTMKHGEAEAMVVHECIVCGAVHKNRCAADDSIPAIINVLRESQDLPDETRLRVQNEGITIVTSKTASQLLEGIFGRGHIPQEYITEFGITDSV